MGTLTYNVNFSCLPDCDAYLMSQLLMARDCYNEVSKVIFEKRISYSYVKVHNVIYYNMRAKFPQLNSATIQQVTKTACANYKTYKTRHKKYPSKALVQKELSFQLAKSNYSNLTKSGINLSCGKRKRSHCIFVSYPKLNEMFDKYKPTSPKLGFRNGHYYLSIPFKFKPIEPKDNSCLGIDLGCRRVVTTSDGVAYSDKEQMALRRKIRFQKRQLRQLKDKNHSHSVSKKLRKLSRKERNQNKDFCHRITNVVLETDKSIIVMEDLRGIKQKTSKTKIHTPKGEIQVKRKSHNNRLGQVPFYMLKEILTYKALLCGKKVATVSPCFTSQTNCLTGQRVGVRNGCRFQLGGKKVYDADWNAAINIRNRFLKYPLSTDIVPTDGKLLVHKGRVCRSTTQKTEGQDGLRPCSLSNPWASCRG